MSIYQSKSGRLYLKREKKDILILLVCTILIPTKEEVLNPKNWSETITLEKIYEIEADCE